MMVGNKIFTTVTCCSWAKDIDTFETETDDVQTDSGSTVPDPVFDTALDIESWAQQDISSSSRD